MSFSIPATLDHITDVGASSGNGSDSTKRIWDQYRNLGVENPHVISAGHSPLRVAFTGLTTLDSGAKNNAHALLKKFDIKIKDPLPVALNSAPRNNGKELHNGKEDYIYRVLTGKGLENYVLYGPEVLKWVKFFHNQIVSVDRILSISDIIPDTSSGSQFRSGEYLPIVHFLEAIGQLDDFSDQENVPLEDIPNINLDFSQGVEGQKLVVRNANGVILPPDEYNNARLILPGDTIQNILTTGKCFIADLQREFVVQASMTDVKQEETSIWPSSNHFPNGNIGVVNVGTRWGEGTTDITDFTAMQIAREFSERVGEILTIEW